MIYEDYIYHVISQDESVNEIILITDIENDAFSGKTLIDNINPGHDIDWYDFPINNLYTKYSIKKIGNKEDHPEYFL